MFVSFKSSIVLACTLLSLTTVATLVRVENATLDIPMPMGWRFANTAEQAGMEAGLKISGGDGNVMFPVIVKPSKKGSTTVASQMAVIFQKGLTEDKATRDDLESCSEILKAGFKSIDGENMQVSRSMTTRMDIEEFTVGDNWCGIWMRSTTSFSGSFKHLAIKSTYSLTGYVLINQHLFGLQLGINSPETSEINAFKRFSRNWIETLSEKTKP